MSTDPSEPEDGLEALFAAEEAAIADEGFTARVVGQAERSERVVSIRRVAIYGSAMLGAGFALGGLMKIAPLLPDMKSWWSNAETAVQTASASAAQGAIDPVLIVAAAVVAGVMFMLAALALQSR